MIIELHDQYGEKGFFITQSKAIPKVGDLVQTPKFDGVCEKLIYDYNEENCVVTVRVR